MTDYKNIVPNAQNGDPKALDRLYKSTSRADMLSNSAGSSSDALDSDPAKSSYSTPSDIPEPVPEDYEYVDIEGGIRITKYNGNDEFLTVPAEIDGKKVLEIDNEFEHNMFIFYDFER